MSEYRIAHPSEENDLLDFINYVFSASSRPHDFKRLLPKVYARAGFSRYHFVALEEGRIRGTVAMLPMNLRVEEGAALCMGYVGSVSVHPYARGRGHMKQLMPLLLQEARRQDLDILALGGLRQRYAYFGFESGGSNLTFTIREENIRHALGDARADGVRFRPVESARDAALDAIYAVYRRQVMLCERPRELFYDIMRSWEGSLYAIEDARGEKDGLLGYLYAQGGDILELALTDERRVPEVIKGWALRLDSPRFTLRVCAHNRVRAAFIKSFAESWRVADAEKIHVLRWQRVIQTLLSFKSGCLPLADGRFVFEVEGEGRYEISVRGHEVTVAQTAEEPEMSFTPQRATEFFFSPYTALMTASPLIKSWLPLPFGTSSPDQF